jgi:hypothetical protein
LFTLKDGEMWLEWTVSGGKKGELLVLGGLHWGKGNHRSKAQILEARRESDGESDA